MVNIGAKFFQMMFSDIFWIFKTGLVNIDFPWSPLRKIPVLGLALTGTPVACACL